MNWLTACFDVTAVSALWLTRPKKNDPTPPAPSRRRVITASSVIAIASAFLWTGYFLNGASSVASGAPSLAQSGDLLVLEPDTWAGKPFPLFNEIEGSAELQSGRWLVVLYHHDCDSCLQAIPTYRQLAERSGGRKIPRISFIAMPPFAAAGDDPVPASPAYLHLSLQPNHDWFATTPVVAALQDGRVIFAAEGEQAAHPPDVAAWK